MFQTSAPVNRSSGRLVREHVVQRAGQPGERVGVLLVAGLLLEVDVPVVVQHVQRVLLGVGVEVTQQEHVVDIALDGGDPRRQRRRLLHARDVAGTLAVALVGVAGERARRPLRLEVVDDHHERRPIARGRERLGDRLARVGERLVGRGGGIASLTLVAERPSVTETGDGSGLVDDRVGDHVHVLGRGSSADDGLAAQVPAPASALSAATRVSVASSAGSPRAAEFSISIRPTTSASSALIAAHDLLLLPAQVLGVPGAALVAAAVDAVAVRRRGPGTPCSRRRRRCRRWRRPGW